jgi:hypothetical protein
MQAGHGGASTTMSGCTWHTVKSTGLGSSNTSPSRAVPLSISQHLPPPSPSSGGGGNPLAALTHQIQVAMMVENSGIGVDVSTASHVTEILLNTVSGISTLRSAVGENVLTELLTLLLKDGPSSRNSSRQAPHLPVGLLDN